MPKRDKKTPAGAPGYMVTYGDMMTLLLCFFVIIVSMSEMKQDQKFQKAIESIRRAFSGYAGGFGYTPTTVPPANSITEQLKQLIPREPELHQGKSVDDGIEGQNPSVTMVRDGLQYTIGGKICFETGRARLLDGARTHLAQFAPSLRGFNYKIRVRGHATPKPPALYAPFKNLDELSFARAMAIKKFLIDQGVRQERITAEACGDSEPIRAQAYDEDSRALNRRVSIIVTESLVEEYEGRPQDEAEGTIK